jgi:hypothetical protein
MVWQQNLNAEDWANGPAQDAIFDASVGAN